jgi:hypothetical protein
MKIRVALLQITNSVFWEIFGALTILKYEGIGGVGTVTEMSPPILDVRYEVPFPIAVNENL